MTRAPVRVLAVGVRFLKNVTGFWLLEQCRAAWGNPTVEELVAAAAGVPVTVGSPEATALGNAVVQGLALGQFERLEDARRWLAIGAKRLVM